MVKAVCCLFLGGTCFLTHASILVNGGFETGDFTDWAQSGWFIETTNPHSGVYDASTGCGGASCTTVGDPNSAYVYQDVTTTAGATYTLSFFYDSGQLATSGSELLVLWAIPAHRISRRLWISSTPTPQVLTLSMREASRRLPLRRDWSFWAGRIWIFTTWMACR